MEPVQPIPGTSFTHAPLFHRHRWKESERFHAPPKTTRMPFVNGPGAREFALQLAMGVTTILYRCETCGAPRTERVLGASTSVSPKET